MENATLPFAASFEHSFGCPFTYSHAILNAALPLFEFLHLFHNIAGSPSHGHRSGWPRLRKRVTVHLHPLGGAVATLLPSLLPELDIHWSAWVPQCCRDGALRWCSPEMPVPDTLKFLVLPLRLDSSVLDCGFPCFKRGSTTARARFMLTGLRSHAYHVQGLRDADTTREEPPGGYVILVERREGTSPQFEFPGLSPTGSDRRSLVNQHELESVLRDTMASHVRTQEREIFKLITVAFEDLPFQQQLQTLHRAAVLVGMHGAGLINCVWLPDRAAVVEFHPKGYSRHSVEWLCGEALHLVYRFSDSLDVVSQADCDDGVVFCGEARADTGIVAAELSAFLLDFWQVLRSHPLSWRRGPQSGPPLPTGPADAFNGVFGSVIDMAKSLT